MRAPLKIIFTTVFLLAAAGPAAAEPILERIEAPTGERSLAPRLIATGEGSAVLSWLDVIDGGHRLMLSEFDGERFGPAHEVTRGSDFFANWADTPGVGITDNGRWLASGSGDRTARLWDLEAPPAKAHLFDEHQDLAIAVATSADGRWLARTFDTHNPALITDRDGVIVRVNRAFTEITGYRSQEVVGRTFHLLSPERNEEEFLSRIWSAVCSLLSPKLWRLSSWIRKRTAAAMYSNCSLKLLEPTAS